MPRNNQQRKQDTRPMGKGMLLMSWLLFFALAWFAFYHYESTQGNPNQWVKGITTPDGYAQVVLERNHYGHYIATGFINDMEVEFIVDTGASSVAIPERLANELGLEKGAVTYVMTASGKAKTYITYLDSLTLGNIFLYNVRAFIVPSMPDKGVLLGMSALKHLEFHQRGDELTLTYIPD